MTETPNGTVVLAFSNAALNAVDDPVDVTEAVKFAYDTVIGSLDWGSGFLSHEEMHQIDDLGRQLGFERAGLTCKRRDIYMPRYNDPNLVDSCEDYRGGVCPCAGYWRYDYNGPCKFEGIDDD